MNNQNPDKDPKKLSEEDLEELLKELSEKKPHKKRNIIALTFMLHPNYALHMVLSLVINTVVFAVVSGLSSGVNEALLNVRIPGFLFAVILLTLIENFIKILLYRYATRTIILSFGMIPLIILIVLLYIIDVLIVEGFNFISIERLLVFSVIFSLLRFGMALYTKRLFYQRKMH